MTCGSGGDRLVRSRNKRLDYIDEHQTLNDGTIACLVFNADLDSRGNSFDVVWQSGCEIFTIFG